MRDIEAPITLHSKSEIKDRLVPVILGGSYLGYSYVRGFHESYGIDQSIILSGVDVKMTSSSRFCDYRVIEETSDEQALLNYLINLGKELKSQEKLGLALGSADWQVRLLASNIEKLSPYYVVPYNKLELFDDITQKERFYEICEELDIPFPKTYLLDCTTNENVKELADSLVYPCIAKPSHSASYDKLSFEGREKIYTVRDAQDLIRIHNLLHDAGYAHSLVVQDFIPGGDDQIRSLTTYSDANGNMRVVAGGRVILQDRSPEAIGNPAVIICEREQEIIEGARRFLKHTGYRGFANFDMKYDERDGHYKFFEVNARCGRNTYYMTLGGVEFTQLFVEDWILGNEIPYQEAYKPYCYTVIQKNACKACIQDQELKSQVLDYFKKGLNGSPLDYAKDSPIHKFWAWLVTTHQTSKFKSYYC